MDRMVSRHLALVRPLAAAALLLVACSGEDGRTPPPPEGVHVRFELAADPMPFGAIPWPDDLYLGEDGRVRVGALPGQDEAAADGYHQALRRSLGELDGFGALSPAFFRFDGAIDPASLPASPLESLSEEASVLLMDVDPASARAFARVPVEARWDEARQLLAVAPAPGHALAAGRRYAVVITDRVRDTMGRPIRPAPAFAAIRDAETRPGAPLEAEAHDHYQPVLSILSSNGVARQEVVALAAFRVQSIGDDLADARDLLGESAPRAELVTAVPAGEALDARLGMPAEDVPGIDVDGGVQHQAIAWMIHGRLESPWLLSSVAGVHGRFERDASGDLVVERSASVPFTLWVPRSGERDALRVVLYQHGFGAERSQALAIVDTLAQAGWAVLSIDAPFHGLRAPRERVDTGNAFTGGAEPDGFGDVVGEEAVRAFIGVDDERGKLLPLHPYYLRDALRQSVVDLLAAVRLIRQGDWSQVRGADPTLESLAFASKPVAYVGHSLGGMVGVPLLAHEPDLGAAVLLASGGHLTRLLARSPELGATLLPALRERLGEPGAVDWERFPPSSSPAFGVWQTLLDRGDPLVHAATLARRPRSVLMVMARHDETVPDGASEALARMLDAPIVGGEPVHVGLRQAEPPVRGNVTVDGTTVTRALSAFDPATHALFVRRRDQRRWARPLEPPFEPIDPMTVDNPVDAIVDQVLHFLESWRAGGAGEIARFGP